MLGRRRGEEGGFSLRTALWVTLPLGLIYFGAMFLPALVDIYEVKSILQEVANTHWRQFDEEAVRKDILDRIKKLSAESEVPNGEARFGGIVLAPEDVLINKDDDAHTLSLQIRYTRYVKYPFLERQTRLELSSSRTLDTTPVKW